MRHFKTGILQTALLLSLIVVSFSCKTGGSNSINDDAAYDVSKIDTVLTGTVTAELTDPPMVPKPLDYTSPKTVMVELTAVEKSNEDS